MANTYDHVLLQTGCNNRFLEMINTQQLIVLLLGILAFKPLDTTSSDLRNRHLKIVTINWEPLVFDVTTETGDIVRGGFVIDLLDKLQNDLNFTYETYISPDGNYGSLVPGVNGSAATWNGMIGEVVSGRADLAAADITITPIRTKDVAFTLPYMPAEIGALYRRRATDESWASFMEPFSLQVWILIGAALLVTSVGLFVISIYDQDEVNLRTVSSCINFSVACIFSQGPHKYPSVLSARIISASWWFLCIMSLVVYTADMTSSLTIDKGELQMEKLEDLLHIPDVLFGLSDGEATSEAFRTTDYVPFQMMYSRMRAFPEDSLLKSGEGYTKARERSDYVFLTESPYIHYEIGRAPCVMTMFIGSNAPKTGGGLGLVFSKENSHWRDVVNVQIARYHQTGFFADNVRRWYDERQECSTNSNAAAVGSGNIGFEKTKGIFLVFSIGLVMAFIAFMVKRVLYKPDKAEPTEDAAADVNIGENPVSQPK